MKRAAGRVVTVFAAHALVVITTGTVAAGTVAADVTTPDPATNPDDERSAGDTTVWATGRNAFSFPFANLTDPERTRFAIGNSFFRRNWVQAPASTTARDGLGPHFIARSCGGCHSQDGRGAPPDPARTRADDPERALGLLIRLSIPGPIDPQLGVRPEPVYGDQFNTAAVQRVRPEGHVEIRTTPREGRFADGERYVLQRPDYRLTRLGYGPLAPDVMMSPRVAPQLIGVGLLEAIAEHDIRANARDQAAQPGPIKGQVNEVRDAFLARSVIGRFGWKANTGSIAHQTAAAFHGDIGITSRHFWREACTSAQQDCLDAPHGGGRRRGREGVRPAGAASRDEPEIDDKTLGDVIFYTATLAPPARRAPRDEEVLRGEALFHAAQCAICHRPGYVTGTPPLPAFSTPRVARQRIWPYTDLLLHDMGPDLADGRPDFLANGRQWRTPPLWGIGLLRDVNGHQRLLHDGRADGVLEAILWHGGEAEASRQQVLGMNKADRDALVRFVESL